jgi:hypothetical protein
MGMTKKIIWTEVRDSNIGLLSYNGVEIYFDGIGDENGDTTLYRGGHLVAKLSQAKNGTESKSYRVSKKSLYYFTRGCLDRIRCETCDDAKYDSRKGVVRCDRKGELTLSSGACPHHTALVGFTANKRRK